MKPFTSEFFVYRAMGALFRHDFIGHQLLMEWSFHICSLDARHPRNRPNDQTFDQWQAAH
jgi:hypothetical protein